MRSPLGVILLTVLLAWAGPVLADEQPQAATACPICSKAGVNAPDYPTKAGMTLTRGVTNTFLGWTELFRQPVQAAESGENIATGVARGVGQTVTRTFLGLGEIVTFWTPKTKNGYGELSRDCPICMGKAPAKKP